MFKKIMVPVDLAHEQRLGKALDTAGAMAKTHGIPVTFVGVTTATPNPLGHNPAEYQTHLEAFTKAQAKAHGIDADSKMVVSHDPATDVDDALLAAVGETGADLVVMATHSPGLADYILPSNGGKVAAHSKASVFLVRD